MKSFKFSIFYTAVLMVLATPVYTPSHAQDSAPTRATPDPQLFLEWINEASRANDAEEVWYQNNLNHPIVVSLREKMGQAIKTSNVYDTLPAEVSSKILERAEQALDGNQLRLIRNLLIERVYVDFMQLRCRDARKGFLFLRSLFTVDQKYPYKVHHEGTRLFLEEVSAAMALARMKRIINDKKTPCGYELSDQSVYGHFDAFEYWLSAHTQYEYKKGNYTGRIIPKVQSDYLPEDDVEVLKIWADRFVAPKKKR